MKKRTAPMRDKELERIRAVLSVREKQFQCACRVLKHLVEFRSAHLSVFESEVHELQQLALGALCEMENLQGGRKLAPRQLSDRAKLIYAKTHLSTLYGKWGHIAPMPRAGRLEDEDG